MQTARSPFTHLATLILDILLVLLLLVPRAGAQDVTPSPTAAPSETPASPATPRAAQPQLTVLAASMNVRSGPGTAYAITGKATKGQRYPVTGRDAAGKWWQVDFNGKPGWLAASLVSAEAGAAAAPVIQAPAVVAGKPAPSAAAVTTPAGPPLPPYHDSITLGDGTTYPVRAHSTKGWGYELVDESKDFDILVNRDIFGVFLNRLSPDLLKTHPKGLRITFRDAEPGIDYPSRYQSSGGFGDSESAYVVAHPCATTHEEHNTIWQNDLVTCDITFVSPGPGLTDIVVAATGLGYARALRDDSSYTPVYSDPPFTLLGAATREVESGQWRWKDPFLQVVSFKPVAAAPAQAATPKGPLPAASGHIAFTRTRDLYGPTAAGLSDIAVVDVKTGEVRVLARNGRQPDVRRDGRIVFNGEGGGRDDLQVIEPDGSNQRPVSMHPEDSAPDWSDGASLAFHSTLAGAPDRIFVQWNGDQRGEPQFLEIDNGSNLRGFTGRYPIWLGSRIAYNGCDEWQKRSVCGVYIFDPGALMKGRTAARSGMKLLTQNPEDRPTDATGDAVLFSSPKAGNWDVYVVPASGGKARNLTNSPSQDLGGTFSPDGNYVAFMSDRAGWGIWIMEADGANPRLLAAVPEGFGKLWDQDRLSWGP